MPSFPTMSCCLATRKPSRTKRQQTIRASHISLRHHSIPRPRSNGRRSGLCATNASSIFPRASCISSTAAPPPSTRIPTAARPAIHAKRQSSRDSSSWWSGMPTRSGGTTDCDGRRSISASSTTPTFAICIPSLPKPTANYGCSTSPATSAFRLMWRYRTGCKTERKISSSGLARTSILALPCCVP